MIKNSNDTFEVLKSLNIDTNAFCGDLKILIDFSNIFRFCNLVYRPSEIEMYQERFDENEYRLIISEKSNTILPHLNKKNTIFLCEEKNSKFYNITQNILLEIFNKYFNLNLSNEIKSKILKMKIKESLYSLIFKIYSNAGVFKEHIALQESFSADPVPFFFKKYYKYKNNKILGNICCMFFRNFFITGNICLQTYFMLIEEMYNNNEIKYN